MKKTLLTAALSLGLVVGAVAPVAAVADERALPQLPESRAEAKERAQQLREEARAEAQQLRENIDAKREEIKARAEERKNQFNQERCERAQSRIEALLPRVSTAAERQQQVLDTMYERVVEFYESKELTVENYEQRVGNVELRKLETADAVTLLKETLVQVDCEADSIGEQLAQYREAASAVRNEVREYRTALVDLIRAMKAAAADGAVNESTNTEGANNA